MEFTIDLKFNQLLEIIKKLPLAQKKKLKIELEAELSESKAKDYSEFQDFLLKGPTMSEEQYTEYKNNRERLNKWRTE